MVPGGRQISEQIMNTQAGKRSDTDTDRELRPAHVSVAGTGQMGRFLKKLRRSNKVKRYLLQ